MAGGFLGKWSVSESEDTDAALPSAPKYYWHNSDVTVCWM